MQRFALLAIATILAATPAARAGEITTTFENLGLPIDTYENHEGLTGQFQVDGNSFNTVWSNDYDYWTGGWAVSSMTDNKTPGFTNPYSSITGGGADGSQTYGVGFTYTEGADPLNPSGSFINLAAGARATSIDVTNTAYAYFTMKDGDAFTGPKFGAGDFFILDIQGYSGSDGTGTQTGTVEFYLADFLNGKQDILDSWVNVDLTSLGDASSLRFGLRSSRNSTDPDYPGMLTPAYFAIDNFTVTTSAVPEPASLAMLAIGLAGIAGVRRKRASRQTTA